MMPSAPDDDGLEPAAAAGPGSAGPGSAGPGSAGPGSAGSDAWVHELVARGEPAWADLEPDWATATLARLVSGGVEPLPGIRAWQGLAPVLPAPVEAEARRRVFAVLAAGAPAWRPGAAARARVLLLLRGLDDAAWALEGPQARWAVQAAHPGVAGGRREAWTEPTMQVMTLLAAHARLDASEVETLRRVALDVSGVQRALEQSGRALPLPGRLWARRPKLERLQLALLGTDPDGLHELASDRDTDVIRTLLGRADLRPDTQDLLARRLGAVVDHEQVHISPRRSVLRGDVRASLASLAQGAGVVEYGALAGAPGVPGPVRAAAQSYLLDELGRAVATEDHHLRQGWMPEVGRLHAAMQASLPPDDPHDGPLHGGWTPATIGEWLDQVAGRARAVQVLLGLLGSAPVAWTRLVGRHLRPSQLFELLHAPDQVSRLAVAAPDVLAQWTPAQWRSLLTHADRTMRVAALAARGAVPPASEPPGAQACRPRGAARAERRRVWRPLGGVPYHAQTAPTACPPHVVARFLCPSAVAVSLTRSPTALCQLRVPGRAMTQGDAIFGPPVWGLPDLPVSLALADGASFRGWLLHRAAPWMADQHLLWGVVRDAGGRRVELLVEDTTARVPEVARPRRRSRRRRARPGAQPAGPPPPPSLEQQLEAAWPEQPHIQVAMLPEAVRGKSEENAEPPPPGDVLLAATLQTGWPLSRARHELLGALPPSLAPAIVAVGDPEWFNAVAAGRPDLVAHLLELASRLRPLLSARVQQQAARWTADATWDVVRHDAGAWGSALHAWYRDPAVGSPEGSPEGSPHAPPERARPGGSEDASWGAAASAWAARAQALIEGAFRWTPPPYPVTGPRTTRSDDLDLLLDATPHAWSGALSPDYGGYEREVPLGLLVGRVAQRWADLGPQTRDVTRAVLARAVSAAILERASHWAALPPAPAPLPAAPLALLGLDLAHALLAWGPGAARDLVSPAASAVVPVVPAVLSALVAGDLNGGDLPNRRSYLAGERLTPSGFVAPSEWWTPAGPEDLRELAARTRAGLGARLADPASRRLLGWCTDHWRLAGLSAVSRSRGVAGGPTPAPSGRSGRRHLALDARTDVLVLRAVARAVVGRAVVGRAVVGRAVVDRAVVGRAVVGRAVVDRAIVDRAVVDRAVVDRAVVDPTGLTPASYPGAARHGAAEGGAGRWEHPVLAHGGTRQLWAILGLLDLPGARAAAEPWGVTATGVRAALPELVRTLGSAGGPWCVASAWYWRQAVLQASAGSPAHGSSAIAPGLPFPDPYAGHDPDSRTEAAGIRLLRDACDALGLRLRPAMLSSLLIDPERRVRLVATTFLAHCGPRDRLGAQRHGGWHGPGERAGQRPD